MTLPDEVPVMTLPNATLFPQAMLPLYIFEPRYRRMLEDTLASHRMFSIAMQKPSCKRETPCIIAGLGLIRASVQNKDGTSHLILQGLTRIRLEDTVQRRPYRVQRISALLPKPDDSVVIDALTTKIKELVQNTATAVASSDSASNPNLPPFEKFAEHLVNVNDPDQIADMTACVMLRESAQRQTILETLALEPRLRLLVQFLRENGPSLPDAGAE